MTCIRKYAGVGGSKCLQFTLKCNKKVDGWVDRRTGEQRCDKVSQLFIAESKWWAHGCSLHSSFSNTVLGVIIGCRPAAQSSYFRHPTSSFTEHQKVAGQTDTLYFDSMPEHGVLLSTGPSHRSCRCRPALGSARERLVGRGGLPSLQDTHPSGDACSLTAISRWPALFPAPGEPRSKAHSLEVRATFPIITATACPTTTKGRTWCQLP